VLTVVFQLAVQKYKFNAMNYSFLLFFFLYGCEICSLLLMEGRRVRISRGEETRGEERRCVYRFFILETSGKETTSENQS